MTNPKLISLPIELLLKIVCQLPDLSHLLNLFCTCSQLHELYTLNREEILARLLNRIINLQCGVATEADACIEAGLIGPDLGRSDVNDFLARWRIRRAEQLACDQNFQDRRRILFYPQENELVCVSKEVASAPLEKWPTRDYVHLMRLHKQHIMIRRCVSLFCNTTLIELSELWLTKQRQDVRRKVLSPSEYRRLYRAFYRFHLYHELFSDKGWNFSEFHQSIWICTFPPHECEEMATVYQWLDDGWTHLLENLDDETAWVFQHSRAKYVDEGLEVFLNMRQKGLESKLQFIREIKSTKLSTGLEYFGSCLIRMSPFRNTTGAEGATDGFPEDCTELTFENDHPDCPNHGWLWAFKYRMSSEFYHYSHCSLRRIGHVMWDRDRLKSWEIYQRPPPALARGNWDNQIGVPLDFSD